MFQKVQFIRLNKKSWYVKGKLSLKQLPCFERLTLFKPSRKTVPKKRHFLFRFHPLTYIAWQRMLSRGNSEKPQHGQKAHPTVSVYLSELLRGTPLSILQHKDLDAKHHQANLRQHEPDILLYKEHSTKLTVMKYLGLSRRTFAYVPTVTRARPSRQIIAGKKN